MLLRVWNIETRQARAMFAKWLDEGSSSTGKADVFSRENVFHIISTGSVANGSRILISFNEAYLPERVRV